jgi:hypothetical protein
VRQYPAVVSDLSQASPVATLALRAAQAVYPDLNENDCISRSKGRLLYTLPSLAIGPNDAAIDALTNKFLGAYNLYAASGAITSDRVNDPVDFTSKVVVIGASAPQALDRHDSPIGPMAGPEIHINAIKAFRNCQSGFVSAPSGPNRIGHELTIIAATSFPFFIFWLGYFGLAAGLRGGRAGFVLPVAGVIGFCGAILFAMAIAVWMTLRQVSTGSEEGLSLEFFTPIFALSLEGFAEGARWSIDRIEARVETLVVGIVRWRRAGRGTKR